MSRYPACLEQRSLFRRLTATILASAGLLSLAACSEEVVGEAPSAPTQVRALSGNESATVSWEAPVSVGSSAITGYIIVGSDGTTLEAGASANSIVATGLVNGTPYTFTVAAKNEFGLGRPSLKSNSVIPATVPDAPTAVTGIPSNASAFIQWTAPEWNGGSLITSYEVTVSDGRVVEVTGTSHSVDGLTNGEAYTFTVAAINTAGKGASTQSAPVIPATVPDEPLDVVAVAGNKEVTVSWKAPSWNGGRDVTSYTVKCDGVIYSGLTESTHVIKGLENGQEYVVTVQAENEIGLGKVATSNPVVPALPPDAPTDVIAVAGKGSAHVSWTAPASTGGSAITHYLVSGNGGTPKQTSELEVEFSGLTNGTPYTFTVKAVNAAGESPASAPSTPVTPADVPGSPTNVVAEHGNASATVRWDAPSDNGSPITRYLVSANGAEPIVVPASQTSHLVPGLVNGTAYSFTVTAENAVGTGAPSAPSAEVTPATKPGAPTNVQGVRGNKSVTVSWTAAAANGNAVSEYFISTNNGAWQSTQSDATQFVVTGLTNGTPYTFRVKAKNAEGEGPESSASTAVTPATIPQPPTDVTAALVDDKVVVAWKAPADTGGVSVQNYIIRNNHNDPEIVVAGVLRELTLTDFSFELPYLFSVSACNEEGEGLPAHSSVVTFPDREWARWPIPATSPSAANYVITADLVTDKVTGLVWQRQVTGQTLRWEEAKTYCKDLRLDNKSDWRLPTLIELSSIIKDTTMFPAVDTAAFPSISEEWNNYYLWSRTGVADANDRAWRIDVARGSEDSENKYTNSFAALCVR